MTHPTEKHGDIGKFCGVSYIINTLNNPGLPWVHCAKCPHSAASAEHCMPSVLPHWFIGLILVQICLYWFDKSSDAILLIRIGCLWLIPVLLVLELIGRSRWYCEISYDIDRQNHQLQLIFLEKIDDTHINNFHDSLPVYRFYFTMGLITFKLLFFSLCFMLYVHNSVRRTIRTVIPTHLTVKQLDSLGHNTVSFSIVPADALMLK